VVAARAEIITKIFVSVVNCIVKDFCARKQRQKSAEESGETDERLEENRPERVQYLYGLQGSVPHRGMTMHS